MSGGRQARWRQELEALGEDVIRHRLANRLPIGDGANGNLPYDFAKDWLLEKAAERSDRETSRYRIVLIVAVISAAAAIVAAVPVVNSWVGHGP
jgi:hypothetical protein